MKIELLKGAVLLVRLSQHELGGPACSLQWPSLLRPTYVKLSCEFLMILIRHASHKLHLLATFLYLNNIINCNVYQGFNYTLMFNEFKFSAQFNPRRRNQLIKQANISLVQVILTFGTLKLYLLRHLRISPTDSNVLTSNVLYHSRILLWQ